MMLLFRGNCPILPEGVQGTFLKPDRDSSVRLKRRRPTFQEAVEWYRNLDREYIESRKRQREKEKRAD